MLIVTLEENTHWSMMAQAHREDAQGIRAGVWLRLEEKRLFARIFCGQDEGRSNKMVVVAWLHVSRLLARGQELAERADFEVPSLHVIWSLRHPTDGR